MFRLEDMYAVLVDRLTRTVLMFAVLLIVGLLYRLVGVQGANMSAVGEILSYLNKNA